MSLRDWFAGQALAGMVCAHGDTCEGYRAYLAENCYRVANAMLAAREKDAQ